MFPLQFGRTSLVLAVPFTASSPQCHCSSSVSSWVSSEALSPLPILLGFWLLGFSTSSSAPLPHLLLLLPDTLPSQSTCMSRVGLQDAGDIEITCSFRDLRVTIVGPAAQATDLLRIISTSTPSPGVARPPSPAATDGSFDLVQAEVSNFVVPETRDQILATFEPCPSSVIAAGRRLVGATASSEGRVRRAWIAGKWAGAVEVGRINTPNRSEPLDLRNRFYAVVSCPGLSGPTIFKSAHSYWRAIGTTLANSPSISHAFPSELEAKIYLQAAGHPDFDTLP